MRKYVRDLGLAWRTPRKTFLRTKSTTDTSVHGIQDTPPASFSDTEIIRDISEDDSGSEHPSDKGGGLLRVLKLHDLLAYGVGSTVGAGIYTVVAVAGALSGPSVTLAFFFCCLACACTGLVYAEFAVRIPQAGSAYTFTYTTFGELIAWTVGWALTLEYCIAAAATARSFGSYIDAIVASFGGTSPLWLNQIETGTLFVISPVSAFLIIGLSTVLLFGVKNSSLFNVVCTVINLIILCFFIIAGSIFVTPSYWSLPPTPDNVTILLNTSAIQCANGTLPEAFPIPSPGGFIPFGFGGIMQAAGILFFSFLGFDSVSTLAEEAARPTRDLPIAIIGSLVIAGVIYIAVSLILVGITPWNYFVTSCDNGAMWVPSGAPLAFAFQEHNLYWAAKIMAFGALIATAVSTFTGLVGQPRVFFRMSRDGLFFPIFGKLNPKTGVPTVGVIIVGTFTATVALFIPIGALADFISLGSLYAFTMVDCSMIYFRYSVNRKQSIISLILLLAFVLLCGSLSLCLTLQPSITLGAATIVAIVLGVAAVAVVLVFAIKLEKRDVSDLKFTCPLVPFVPMLGILVNVFMMASRSPLTYYSFLIWFAIGLGIYFFWGSSHSALRGREGEDDDETKPLLQ